MCRTRIASKKADTTDDSCKVIGFYAYIKALLFIIKRRNDHRLALTSGKRGAFYRFTDVNLGIR